MNARSRDGMNIAGTGDAVTCKFCLAKQRGPVPVPTAVTTSTAVATRTIARSTALQLLHAVYRHHGWCRAGGESMVGRVHALYDVTAEPGRNRYVARPKTSPSAVADPPPALPQEPPHEQ
ncbi:hypothetical protein K7574_21195 (plasmid) [Stenotrophomonas maltophilia]|uniref:hypothetical protein n=1 Tax=Stenotrophomonas maltophilia TaxID=40324 RepID=UPI001D0CAB7E|nr:hypothetical protein [Stenotrophomonas maltophilia]UXF74612.1 hypothetical protein K7574_21195 [Stenotrophomonas maltophilia]